MFALIGPGEVIVKTGSNFDAKAACRAGYRIVPVIDTNPAFDGETQKKTGPVVTVLADKVTRVWTVTALTAQELATIQDARQEDALAAIARANDIIKALGTMVFELVNDVRVLKGQGTITAAQFKTALKARL